MVFDKECVSCYYLMTCKTQGKENFGDLCVNYQERKGTECDISTSTEDGLTQLSDIVHFNITEE